MIRRIVWLIAGIALAVSVAVNILAFAGALNPQALVREKDEAIARFTDRVKALEEKNEALEEAQRFLESKLEKFNGVAGPAKADLGRIMDAYYKLKAGMR